MWTSSQLLRILPVVLTIAAVLLSMLALFAGNRPGVLENYHIITVDTSRLCGNPRDKNAGPSLISARAVDGNGDGGKDTGTEKNGPRLSSFYSFYTLAMCEGDMTPDGASQLTECHPFFSRHFFTIPAISSAACCTKDENNTTTNNDNSSSSSSNSNYYAKAYYYDDDDGRTGLGYGLQFAVDNLITLLKTVAAFQAIGIGLAGLAAFAAVPAVSLDDEDCKGGGGGDGGDGGGPDGLRVASARQRYSWAASGSMPVLSGISFEVAIRWAMRGAVIRDRPSPASGFEKRQNPAWHCSGPSHGLGSLCSAQSSW
ncbi:hypothetical protein VTH06DRAFT_4773 [Thermothelomyces fergusii]